MLIKAKVEWFLFGFKLNQVKRSSKSLSKQKQLPTVWECTQHLLHGEFVSVSVSGPEGYTV